MQVDELSKRSTAMKARLDNLPAVIFTASADDPLPSNVQVWVKYALEKPFSVSFVMYMNVFCRPPPALHCTSMCILCVGEVIFCLIFNVYEKNVYIFNVYKNIFPATPCPPMCIYVDTVY